MNRLHARAFALRAAAVLPIIVLLPACASLGSVMSPYAESFSCKNKDHGQCVHPAQAYEDAVAGRASRAIAPDKRRRPASTDGKSGFTAYRDSVYQELKGLIDAPVTPMLKPARTVRTLILPYSDRQRPDRLYMARFVFSLLDRPEWVVGGYLVQPATQADRAPVLGQVKEATSDPGDGQ